MPIFNLMQYGEIPPFVPSRLPKGYTEVEYIGCSGTQWIDIGIKASQDTRILCDFMSTYVPQDESGTGAVCMPVFGAATQYNSSAFEFWSIMGGWTSYDGNDRAHTMGLVANQRVVVDKNKNVTTLGSVTKTQTYNAFTTPKTVTIFATNRGTLYICASPIRIYSFKMYDNEILVRDFVPCKNASGAAGLYDLVSQEFYGNSGTRAFTAGAEVKQ